jgi:hypothetical protein
MIERENEKNQRKEEVKLFRREQKGGKAKDTRRHISKTLATTKLAEPKS